jgi:hypothetical protein
MAGRKRKFGVRRKPNGQPLYNEKIEPTPETKARREALFGHWAERGELNCPIDCLRSRLTKEQFWAGRLARSTYARYAIAIGCPRVVAGMLEDYIEGGGGDPVTPETRAEAVKKYNDLITAIGKSSRTGLKEVERIMHGSPPRNFENLIRGLEAICDYLDLRERKVA